MTENLSTAFESRSMPLSELVLSKVAEDERVGLDVLTEALNGSRAVLLSNMDRSNWMAVGTGLSTKVNANIGTSNERPNFVDVIHGAKAAVKAGAHTLMDLSTQGIDGKNDFSGGIRALSDETGAIIGTVPIYEAVRRSMERHRSDKFVLDGDEMLEIVERQAEAGSRFMAIHSGLNQRTLSTWQKMPRNIVSKGGYLTAEYMLNTGRENPFFDRFEELLGILKRHEVCLNLGSALRSGATRFNDDAQLDELRSAAELADQATAAGVQVVMEGPGHVPLASIGPMVRYQQEISKGRPFFILGFVTTDAFPGYDHIASAIGATEAVRYGVSWLCYITPAEHIRMPREKDVVEGVYAARVAAHVADCANGQPKALEIENSSNDKGCLNPKIKRDWCTICGQDFCPIRRMNKLDGVNLEGDVNSAKEQSV